MVVSFEAGDVVCLKGGGPAMTVEAGGFIPGRHIHAPVKVAWFDGNLALRRDDFPHTSLKHYVPSAGQA